MAYTLNHGVNSDNMDRVQRGLLMGLPVIAVILSIGAILHHHPAANQTGLNPKVIPVVSAAKQSPAKSNSSNGHNSGGTNASAQTAGVSGGTGTGGSAVAGGLSTSSTSTGSSGGGTIGGRGGGPVGGGSTGGSGGGTGGGVTVPNCSIGQIASVTCQVPACSPAVTLSPGQKAIAGVGGACIVVN